MIDLLEILRDISQRKPIMSEDDENYVSDDREERFSWPVFTPSGKFITTVRDAREELLATSSDKASEAIPKFQKAVEDGDLTLAREIVVETFWC